LIQELADEESIPKKFLEQILIDLKSHGLVSSKKGRGGGYVVARPPEDIALGTVIRHIESPLAPP
jgi:Rrf2 family protein